jgi:hypothetical protein
MVQDVDRGEVLCDDCGVIDHLDNLDSSGHVRFGDGSQNSVAKKLGSTLNGKRASKEVSWANKLSQESTIYLEELFDIVVKDLLKSYDKNDSLLWRKRKKLHGGRDKIYKMRVFVVGALAALRRSMRHNQANEIALRWGVDRNDLNYSTTMFRRYMLKASRCTTPNKREIQGERKAQLYFYLERFREILAERVGWEVAKQVLEGALEELSENYEPVYDNEDSEEPIQSTKYGTKSSESASWEAFLVSMVDLGMGPEVIRWLLGRAVPSSAGNVTRAYSKEAIRRAALSGGSEEE